MNLNKPIIALVDDDKIFQLTASRTILSTNITDRVLQFENGEDALNFLKAHHHSVDVLPDYIFLDINMPFIDGWMFLDDFKKVKKDLSKQVIIYMVSSSIDPRDINRAKSYDDVTEYVVKPVTRDKFIELLNKAA